MLKNSKIHAGYPWYQNTLTRDKYIRMFWWFLRKQSKKWCNWNSNSPKSLFSFIWAFLQLLAYCLSGNNVMFLINHYGHRNKLWINLKIDNIHFSQTCGSIVNDRTWKKRRKIVWVIARAKQIELKSI